MVLTRLTIFNFSSQPYQDLRIVSSAPITTGTTRTLMFHSFLVFWQDVNTFFHFSFCLLFTPLYSGTAKFTIWPVLLFFCEQLLSLIFLLGLLTTKIREYVKYPRKNKFSKSKETTNHLRYMDDNKVIAKIFKDLETLIQIIRIYSRSIWLEFAMLIMKARKNKQLKE